VCLKRELHTYHPHPAPLCRERAPCPWAVRGAEEQGGPGAAACKDSVVLRALPPACPARGGSGSGEQCPGQEVWWPGNHLC